MTTFRHPEMTPEKLAEERDKLHETASRLWDAISGEEGKIKEVLSHCEAYAGHDSESDIAMGMLAAIKLREMLLDVAIVGYWLQVYEKGGCDEHCTEVG